jgi:hypothetical protein
MKSIVKGGKNYPVLVASKAHAVEGVADGASSNKNLTGEPGSSFDEQHGILALLNIAPDVRGELFFRVPWRPSLAGPKVKHPAGNRGWAWTPVCTWWESWKRAWKNTCIACGCEQFHPCWTFCGHRECPGFFGPPSQTRLTKLFLGMIELDNGGGSPEALQVSKDCRQTVVAHLKPFQRGVVVRRFWNKFAVPSCTCLFCHVPANES